jgi:hypothetical protein
LSRIRLASGALTSCHELRKRASTDILNSYEKTQNTEDAQMNDITTIVEKITELVKTRLNDSEKSVTMTEIERTTRELLLELGRQVVEKTTQAMAQKYPEETSDCECGQKATYIRQRKTQLRTLFGKLNVKRAYYLCDDCQTGHYPLDQQLGLRPNALSAELARLVGLTGVHIPYGKGSELLQELAQISVSQPCLAKTTGQIGEVVQEREEKLKQKPLSQTIWQNANEKAENRYGYMGLLMPRRFRFVKQVSISGAI